MASTDMMLVFDCRRVTNVEAEPLGAEAEADVAVEAAAAVAAGLSALAAADAACSRRSVAGSGGGVMGTGQNCQGSGGRAGVIRPCSAAIRLTPARWRGLRERNGRRWDIRPATPLQGQSQVDNPEDVHKELAQQDTHEPSRECRQATAGSMKAYSRTQAA